MGDNIDLQKTILVSCPTCYGSGGWPLYLLVTGYFLCLFVSTYRVILEFKKKTTKKNWWKLCCLIALSSFLFLKSMFMLVPYPHVLFTDVFVCDQLPRYFLFLSFQFLALWLGGVVFKGVNICCSIIVPIFLLLLSLLALVALVVFSYFSV
jgi:hypothetical protein